MCTGPTRTRVAGAAPVTAIGDKTQGSEADGCPAWLRAKRGAEYDALKARLARETLSLLLANLPELADAIEHVEMSSPLTTRFFAGHAHGETCGLDHNPLRFRRGPSATTPIAGLFLTGQDAWLCGVGGSASGGLACASAVLRRDLAGEILFGR